jgi:hypothetical protein
MASNGVKFITGFKEVFFFRLLKSFLKCRRADTITDLNWGESVLGSTSIVDDVNF